MESKLTIETLLPKLKQLKIKKNLPGLR